ncbi:hypothetical protein ACSAGD_00125 [Paramicrobacterium sp. CJ85]|uniref:hypothetical protein n=1 Tax=Paramicrobacterium sp. CJ85 TaxID=3445355 RepID=UPI003F5DD95E
MWRPGSIITLIIGAVVGGALAAGGYVFVGALIESMWFSGGRYMDLAAVYGLIAAAAGAAIGLTSAIGASFTLVAQRHSSNARRRVAWATVVAVVCGVVVLAVTFGFMGTLPQNLIVLGVEALLIAVLAWVGISASERHQRAR